MGTIRRDAGQPERFAMDPNAPTAEPATGATPPTGTSEPAKTEPAKEPADGLGEAGKKALAEERAARKALEQQVKALEPLTKLAEALGVKPEPGKTDVQTLTEQVAALQKQAAEDRVRAMRAEIAAEKKLPKELADRMQGSTREELLADAERLVPFIPAQSGTPGTPQPDPTQGPRGAGAGELEAQIAAAKKAGNTKEQIRLMTLLGARAK